MDNYLYSKFLISILNNEENIDTPIFKEYLEYNTYLTLLFLSNFKYPEDIINNNSEKVNNFLRKLNNLKVKIQLKRKVSEIDNFKDEVLSIYDENYKLINKYHKFESDIKTIILEKDPKNLTTIIDDLTKSKKESDEKYEDNIKLRNNIQENITNNKEIDISYNEFISLYDYLLDINIYPNNLLTPHSNREKILLVNDLINIIESSNYINISNNIIPISLTYISMNNINYSNLDTSKFNIDNIKIQDLYSNSEKVSIANHAKWQNIALTNDYLFSKIVKIVKDGTYYFENNKFFLEEIIDNASNFKISISIEDIKLFLINILENI